MNNKLLKILNPIMFIVAIIQVGTVISFYFVRTALQYKLHVICGTLLVILIAIHLTLNFGWIKAQLKKK